jgi:hypothetical protein
MLYDLSRDPRERHNLAGAHPDRRDRLRALHDGVDASSRRLRREGRTIPLDAQEVDHLRALGYVR